MMRLSLWCMVCAVALLGAVAQAVTVGDTSSVLVPTGGTLIWISGTGFESGGGTSVALSAPSGTVTQPTDVYVHSGTDLVITVASLNNNLDDVVLTATVTTSGGSASNAIATVTDGT